MKRKLFLQVILFFISTSAFSQSVEFEPDNFPNDKKGLKEAVSNLRNGDEAYFALAYSEALTYFLAANKFNPNNAELNLKIGNCYINSTDKKKAIEHIQKAIKLKPDVDIDAHYLLGKAYHLNYEWDKAIEEYSRCLGKKSETNDAEVATAQRRIQECNNGKELMKNPVKVNIDNLGTAINTQYKEYVPVISADETDLYFTSRRPGSTGSENAIGVEDYFEDIYFSEMKNGKWTQAKNIGPPVNSDRHDATVNLSVDGQRLFIYRDANAVDADISEVRLRGKQWSEPKKLNNNINTKFQETSASFSPDEKVIYFVSNKPGGYGGKDIYLSRLTPAGDWGKAENLGPPVNTEMDEDAVFMHPDGKTIYFCSNGHKTMGGFDIFKTVSENGKWSEPVNIGYPINTPDNDVSYVLSASGKHGYYASAREGSFGERDIFMISFLEDTAKKEEPQLTLLSGTVTDEGGLPLEANVEVIDNVLNLSVAKFMSNKETGKYLVSLPSGRNYGIVVRSEGRLFHSENIDIPLSKGYAEVTKPITLQKPEVGKKIILKNIFYDFDKANLRMESMSELARVLEVLNEMPALKIEVSSHTDSKGSDEYNNKLSQSRAQAVVDYLLSKGIKTDRVVAKGYGKAQPVATNETEEGRQLNRRTEFRILSR
jgi:outer membrane protein OmpA-like peptidoglycan-associated protein